MVEEGGASTSEYVDAEATHGGNKDLLSFRFITMEHLQRVCRLQSCDFGGGGYYRTVTQVVAGVPRSERVWVADPRAAYVNAVIGLYNLLASHVSKYVPSKKKAVDHKALVEGALRKVEDDLRGVQNSDAARLALVLDTHVLLRCIVAFLQDKNFLTMSAEDDV